MVHHITKVQQKCSEERDFRKFQNVKICGETSIYAGKRTQLGNSNCRN